MSNRTVATVDLEARYLHAGDRVYAWDFDRFDPIVGARKAGGGRYVIDLADGTTIVMDADDCLTVLAR